MIVYAATKDGVAVNLFTWSNVTVDLATGGKVDIAQTTGYPSNGTVKLVVNPAGVKRPFAIRLRKPVWSRNVSVRVNGKAYPAKPDASGYVTIKRAWKRGDKITYTIDMSPRIVLGDYGNAGRMAVMYGPLVLAADRTRNPQADDAFGNVAFAADDPAKFKLEIGLSARIGDFASADGLILAPGATTPSPCRLNLVPFYEAGNDLSPFIVWMKRPAALTAK